MQTTTFKGKNIFMSFLPALFFLFAGITAHAQIGINTTDPKSTFEVNGSNGQTVTTVAASTTLDITHSIVICDNGATPITITLPAAVEIAGRIYTIKREAESTASVTITTTSSQTIDGATSLILKNAGDIATVISNGSQWKTTNNSNSPSSWSVNGNAGTNPATNFVGTIDDKDLVLKTNNTARVNITKDGITTIGGATDHTKFETDGTIVLEGAATVWDDFLVNPDATSRGGSKAPVWGGSAGNAFKNNGGSQGVFLWMFSPATEQEVYFTVQLPHKYKVGTNLLPHVHWTTAAGTPSGTDVVWGLEYTVMAIGGSFPATVTLTANSVIAAIGTPAGTAQHLISSLGPISGTGIGISTILVCRLYRVAASGSDTFANEVGLLSMDFHYEIDTEGSRSEYVK